MAKKLYDLIDINSPGETFAEIKKTLSLIDPDYVSAPIKKVYSDIICLFAGEYPGSPGLDL